MDFYKYFPGLIALLVISVLQTAHAKDGFICTLPKTLRHGSTSKFCLTAFSHDKVSQAVTMSLTNSENGNTTKIQDLYQHGEQKCKEFLVPEAGEYEMLLYNDTDILHDSVKVTILGNKLITLVQTDKPMYKPGQKVKFRILTLLKDLKPRVGKIRSIFIRDPDDFKVKQYLNVDTKGISSLEFQLVAEAKLGIWKIDVIVDESDEKQNKIYSEQFEVKEYVLPRFEVTIKPPAYILKNAKTIEGTVCAKYTYGKPVTGFLDLEVCWGRNYGPPRDSCIHDFVEISGCFNFSVNATELKQSGHNRYFGTELKIKASVSEAGTNAVVNKTHSGPSESYEPLKIEMEDYTNGFFKPGLPFYGKIIVTRPDGTPAEGEVIQISAVDHENKLQYSSNLTTNESGIITYALCGGFTENTTSISLNAIAVEYNEEDPKYEGLSTPRGYRQISQWFSPSLSYLQIPRIDHQPKCGARLTLSIPFTTRHGRKTEFKYQVMTRGEVVNAGKILYDERKSYPNLVKPHPDICLQWEQFPTRPPPPTEEIMTEDNDDDEDEEDDIGEEEVVDGSETDATDEEIGPPPRYTIYPELPSGDFQEPIERSELLSDTVSTFQLDLRITPLMSPKFSLLIYHVLPDGEVVADSMQFMVEPCFDNEVKMKFNKTSALPGEDVSIKLEAAPGSVCGVGVVDKSVNILGGKHQITPEKVLEKIEEFSSSQFGQTSLSYQSDNEYCEKRIRNLEVDESPENAGGFWYYSSVYVDAIQAFKAAGFMVLTNLNLETRPCGRNIPVFYDNPVLLRESNNLGYVPGPIAPRTGLVSIHKGPFLSKTSVRSHFPETWLWDLQVIGDTGISIIQETTPHTITNWVGNTMCLDQDKGFGISELTSITTFQPFFLSLHLPYSAVRGERLPIMLTVYNYLEKCLNIQLSLDMEQGFEVHNRRQYRDPVCVCGGKSFTAKFYVTPKDIGSLPVIAEAQIVAGFCDNSVEVDMNYIGLADAVKRQMLVKAEGVVQQYTHTIYMCSKDGQSKDEEVVLPLPEDKDIVEDSARGEVKIIGDIMGPALTNLDNLVRMPTGCGEQNMVGFVPNIFVMEYLINTRQLTEEIQTNAIKYMEIGYQKELKYRHKDGSYSAFGDKDPRGSVWLTAFVVKSFAQARPYIYVDETDMALSIAFLRRSQLETGCFRETGKVFSSYMMGGLSKKKKQEESHTALTAYVLIALLTSHVNKSEQVVGDALRCINRDFQKERRKMDPYSLALVAYANALYEPFSHTTREVMKVLDSKAKMDGSLKYWGRESSKPKPVNTWYYYAAPSAEVEMTSYALLAHFAFYEKRAIEHTHNIAMWLSKQRNPFGGFSSTQDTVIGLQALSEFANMAHKDATELEVFVSGKRLDKSFTVSEKKETTLLLQTVPISFLPNKLNIGSTGKGCALIQSSVYYNKRPEQMQSDERPSFHLKVSPRLYQHDINRCDRRTITISVGSRGSQSFSKGMSLIMLKMVTSWAPVPQSLKKLISLGPKLGLKKYEYDETQGILTLYFDEFSRKNKEFTVDVEQDRDLKVSNPKPAEVKVFQYYETDVSVVRSYELKTICGTKLEIPRNRPVDPDMPFLQTRLTFPPLLAQPVGEANSACPVCIPNQVAPENFAEIVCSSKAVYKSMVGRNGKKPIKLYHDLRPVKRVKNLKIFASYTMADECECSLLDPPSKRVLILVREKVSNKLLKLDSTSVVIRSNKKMIKQVRKIQKSCPLKQDNNS